MCNKLDLDKLNNSKDNSMLRARPYLFELWDFDKNKEIDIYEVSRGSDKLAWWTCNVCNENYEYRIELINRGRGCPYCSGKRVANSNCLATLRPDIINYWSVKNKITPYDVTCGSSKKVWWYCGVCDDEYPMVVNKKTSGRGCSICSGYYTTRKNSFGGLFPDIATQWHPSKNGELTPYDVSRRSGKKVWWKCSECNFDYQMTVDKRSSMDSNSNYCTVCSSGLSFGEKIVYELLSISNLDFNREKSFGWSNNRRYDFYIEDFNCIIEVHGEQHFTGSFSRLGGRTLDEELINDKLKYEMAIENGIINYIIIKTTRFDLSKFKEEIITSGLLDILKINESKLDEISKFKTKSIVTKTWNMYNEGFSVVDISSNLKMHRKTIIRYLKLGSELNKCDYTK